ncbi:helix-turn-helix domain-containing protein [Streptomyces cellulosae]|uniref:helix-turn-helix domain-containing protein n=1 Tax=Streptomyces cellulosae TaxID=1968 RepID=UPI00225A26C2|nr:helix-turn-helix domain-containing protein [Streptomyces cellulosae]WTB86752.1 helix-turn-helix domain-containing protein [Streptomyces cellulosae]WTB92874.1 helix-turn-helix domain-containing protein [Streptomyces cellulosae]WTB93230.1 helix-turn-helix domain-containing protein [Streptomyces cellulosae]WTB93518.1 helix-turn-helix domain-containing protein [Streptomyces cellulosae]
MSDFDAIDSLLASLTPQSALPEARVRRGLRERAGLSKAQLARTLGVSPSTVTGWETGRDPSGELRTKYAYLLEGLAAKLAPSAPQPADEATAPPSALDENTTSPAPGPAADDDMDDVEALAAPEPCVLCGQPARHQVAGFPQHLDPAQCATTAPAPDTSTQQMGGRTAKPVKAAPAGRRATTASDADPSGPIAVAVAEALQAHEGDVEAATASLVKRAIPDAMALLDDCRRGGRYAIVAHPWIPDILRKQSARGADQVWEARPKWTRPGLPAGRHEVTALDINGAYLSALKTHLPLGQLEHSTGNVHDRRRAGVYLITPPAWEHGAYLPNPIGNRDEPGPLWVTEPTLRLLLRLSGPKYGLCEPPEIHESFTSGATESLLEKFRIELKDARDTAIAGGDEVTLEYVKAMYSKFVSTMGESNYNRELYRPDWMHLIRSQAFANLWTKALKAHDAGLAVVRVMGTDELHVVGDWRRVFPEGRGVSEVKVKDVYSVGTASTDPAAAGHTDEN